LQRSTRAMESIYISYNIVNNTIFTNGAYGKLINNSDITQIEWEGSFESTWQLISKENDYT